jgi:hypothetical protein
MLLSNEKVHLQTKKDLEDKIKRSGKGTQTFSSGFSGVSCSAEPEKNGNR